MSNTYLTQNLSQFNIAPTCINYVFPTSQNISAGVYASEILDVKEVINPDGSLQGFDFYHRLTDSNGKILHVRFRYYDSELHALAQELTKYPSVQTWCDTVGLPEVVTVAPKKAGNYLRIQSRVANPSKASSSTTLGSVSKKLSSKSTSSPPRRTLLSDNDDEYDDFLDDIDE